MSILRPYHGNTSNTMRGEFYRLPPVSHPPPVFEGGHAMALVGYSDTYRTAHGFVRGAPRTRGGAAGARPGPHARPASHRHPDPALTLTLTRWAGTS